MKKLSSSNQVNSCSSFCTSSDRLFLSGHVAALWFVNPQTLHLFFLFAAVSLPFLCLFSFLRPLVLDFGGFLRFSSVVASAGSLDRPAATLDSPVDYTLDFTTCSSRQLAAVGYENSISVLPIGVGA